MENNILFCELSVGLVLFMAFNLSFTFEFVFMLMRQLLDDFKLSFLHILLNIKIMNGYFDEVLLLTFYFFILHYREQLCSLS